MIWHLITSEYPPQPGGVSDYTSMVAAGLASAGDEVHVWCPSAEGERLTANGVIVHRELGCFAPSDLRRVGLMLDQFKGPRRLLIQWVPHGYGYRSMNLPFCIWLWRRAHQGDSVEIMVHEPYLSFWEGSWKQNGVAVLHRLMTVVLLRAAHRVWMSIPAWESCWRPYALGRSIKFDWLPVASTIPVIDNPDGVKATRARYSSGDGALVGHFGAYDSNVADLLQKSVPAVLQNGAPRVMLLLGRGSELTRDELVHIKPELADRVHATGTLAADELSLHVSACDLMLQPYIDGVSSRRTSTLVALAHGVPVITTSGRLTEPLWAESEAVVMAPVADMSALVEATRRLLPDVASRQRMSAAARTLYATRFDIRQIIAKLREAVA